jgi:hypothetical protein
VNLKYNEEETNMTVRRKATVLAVVVVLVLSAIVAVQTVLACEKGCTPGFWKQLEKHGSFWTGYSPTDTVGEVFEWGSWQYYEHPHGSPDWWPENGWWEPHPHPYLHERYPDLANDTLLEALNYNGGPGIDGAARILLRAAVATLLNSAYDAAQDPQWDWGYEHFNVSYIIDYTNLALLDGAKTDLPWSSIWWAEEWDGLNNLGCPLLED